LLLEDFFKWPFGQPLNSDSTQGISHRFMLKVREDGVDIDSRKLIGTCRRMGNTYSEFRINSTSRGNNVLALKELSYDVDGILETVTVYKDNSKASTLFTKGLTYDVNENLSQIVITRASDNASITKTLSYTNDALQNIVVS